MSEHIPAGGEGSQPPAGVRPDAVLAEFRGALIAGRKPRIEDFLARTSESGRPSLLRGLVTLELAYRLRIGERPTLEEYQARFPNQERAIETAFHHSAEAPAMDAASLGPGGSRIAPGLGQAHQNRPRDSAVSPAQAPKSTDPASAHQFGDYELLQVIARDDLGVVYKAHQVSLDRFVALKLIMAGESVSDADVQTFYREARAAADLDHPGIVPIFEIGQHQGQHFVSMGFIEGQSLVESTARAPMALRDAVEVIKQVAETIAFAHGKDVVHRNLTPKTILLNARRRPKVTGFGLSATLQAEDPATITGRVVGTPGYMAPEQAADDRQEVGPATDVYALGAVLYFLLTGRPPFRGANPVKTLAKVLKTDPKPPSQINPRVPRDLEIICLKCLRKSPDRRYSTAADLAEDLGHWLRNEPIAATPEGLVVRLGRLVRNHPIVRNHPTATVAVASALAAAVLVTVLVPILRGSGSSPSPATAPLKAADARPRPLDSTGDRKSLITRGKSALALVEVSGDGRLNSGSAFSIDTSGLFVTAAHVIAPAVPPGSGTVRLVLHGGGPDQKILPARVVRADAGLDLAVLKIDLTDDARLTPLELGKDDDLLESMEVTAFGYPLGMGPSVSVNTGRITALRRGKDGLTDIQLDAALNPGNSGGPVLDGSGKVIGVVKASIPGASGLNYAIPVDRLARYLAAPEIVFDPPAIRYEDRVKPVVWTIDVHPPMTAKLPPGVSVLVKLQSGGSSREVAARPRANGRFEADVIPMSVGRVELDVTINGQTYRGQASDQNVKIDGTSYAMSDLQRLDKAPKFLALTAVGKELNGPVDGLGPIDLEQGGRLQPLDLKSASSIAIRLPAADPIEATVEVKKGASVLATARRKLAFVGAAEPPRREEPAKPTASPSPAPSQPVPGTIAAAPPPAGAPAQPSPAEIELGGVIADVVLGSDRHLIIVLKEPKKLLVFDTATNLSKEMLLSERPLVTAGRGKLVLAYPALGIFQRWEIATLTKEKEEITTLPSGVRLVGMAMGSDSVGPILVLWHPEPPANFQGSFSQAVGSVRASLIDLASLNVLKVSRFIDPNARRSGNSPPPLSRDGRAFTLDSSFVSPGLQVRASTQGTLFTVGCWAVSASLMVWETGTARNVLCLNLAGGRAYGVPAPDGRTIFSDRVVRIGAASSTFIENPGGHPAGALDSRMTLPTPDPAYLLLYHQNDSSNPKIEPNVSVLDSVGETLLSVPTPELKGLNPRFFRNEQKLAPDKRLWLFKEEVLLTIPQTDDRLVLRKIALREVTDRELDRLHVLSPTALFASTGQPFRHQLRAVSRSGGFVYSLSKGPPNMSISPDGTLTWTPSSKFTGKEVFAAVSVRDASGQEILHTLNILVR